MSADPASSFRRLSGNASDAKRVVVAGGSGFIGQRLCQTLLADGFEVTILTRGKREPKSSGIRYLTWDPEASGSHLEKDAERQTETLKEALSGARAVVNLCGESIAGPRWTDARKRELTKSRTQPTETLVAAVAELDQPPAVFIQASGVGYAGTGQAAIDESAPAGQDFLARLAVAWENPVERLAIRSVILRFGVVLDVSGGALPQMLLPFRLFVGGPIGSGKQWLSWVHVDDAVAAIRFAIDSDLSGPVHVTAPEPVRNASFASTVGRLMRRPALLTLPRFVMTAALGEQATLVCDGQRAIPARLLAAGYEFRFPTLDRALHDLLSV